MRPRGFQLVALAAIGAAGLAIFFLIPRTGQLLYRAMLDNDLPLIRSILERSGEGEDPIHKMARAHLRVADEPGRLDGNATVSLSEPFLAGLADRRLAPLAISGLEQVLARATRPEDVGAILARVPSTDRAAAARAVLAAALAEGNPAAAAEASEAVPSPPPASAVESARLWRKADRVDRAVAALEGWFSKNPPPWPPDAAPAAETLLGLYAEENQNARALEFLSARSDALADLLGGETWARALVAAALASGKPGAGTGPLRTWLEAHPDHPGLWLSLADLAIQSGNPPLAAEANRRFLEQNPDDRERRLRMAAQLEWAGEPGKAFEAWLPLAAEGSREALDRLIALAPGLKRTQDLTGVLPKFLPSQGTSPELLLLARLLVEQCSYEDARKLFRQHLSAQPDDLGVILELARLDEVDEIFDEARDLYLRAEKLDPDDPEIARAIARLDWIEGRYDGLVARLGNLARKTKDSDIIQQYYSAAESLGEIPALIEATELKIATAKKTDPNFFRILAYHHALLGEEDAAQDALRRAAAAFPSMRGFQTDLAYRLSAAGKPAEALAALGPVGAGAPAEVKLLYGELLAASGKRAEALAFLENALPPAASDDPAYLEFMADLMESAGRAAVAEAILRKLALKKPGDSRILLALARSLGAQGKKREMRDVLRPIDLSGEPVLRRDVAQLYMDLEEYPSASALLRSYLASDAGRPDQLGWRMLGDSLLSSGDPVNAKRAYRRSLGLAKGSR